MLVLLLDWLFLIGGVLMAPEFVVTAWRDGAELLELRGCMFGVGVEERRSAVGKVRLPCFCLMLVLVLRVFLWSGAWG